MIDDQPRFISTPSVDNRRMSALADVLAEIWRYKWVVPLVATLTVALVAFATLRQTKIYEANATLEYDPNPPQPMGRNVDDSQVSPWELQEFYETQNFILRSLSQAERVARALHLDRDTDFMFGAEESKGESRTATIANAAALLLKAIEITQVRDTRVVRIRVRDRKPERAQRIANAWVDEYMAKSLEDRLGTTGRALEWLGDQMQNLKSEVENSELALYRYRQQHGSLSASLEDRQQIIASQLQRFSEEAANIRARRIQATAKLEVLRESLREETGKGLDATASVIAADHEVAAIRAAYRSAQEEMQRLLVVYGTAHPQVRGAQRSADSLKEQLAVKIQGIVRSVESEVREYERAERGLQAAIEEVNRQGHALSLQLIDYSRLEREKMSTIKLYEAVMERTAETDLARALRISNARPVDLAILPSRPASPNVKVWIAAGVFAGLILGVLAALVVGYLDNKVRGPADMEARGVTLLGVLPQLGSEPILASYGRKRRRGRRIDHSERDLAVHLEPRSTSAECCRTIRTNLTFQSVERPLRALAVTSAMPRDGKTTVAISIATVLAQSGRSVLLIDTDLRKPRLHRAFKTTNTVGVSSHLSAQATFEEAVFATQVSGLSIMPSGPIPPNPSELLHTRRFASLIEEGCARFDTVILDTPPLGAVTDPAVISTQVDGTVLVVRSGITSRAAVDAALRQLRGVSARLIGVVLNAVDLSDSEYGSYYASYRGYYAEDDGGNRPPPATDSPVSS